MEQAPTTHDRTAQLILRGIESAKADSDGLHHGWARVAAWITDHDPELAEAMQAFSMDVQIAIVEHERK